MTLLHCKRGCRYEHTDSCLALREIVYLGQVGALDHLNELAEQAGLQPAVEDVEYVPCGGATSHQSAYPYYERALAWASKALEGGVVGLDDVVGTLVPAMARARVCRAALSNKPDGPLPVPGRHGWLVRVEVQEVAA